MLNWRTVTTSTDPRFLIKGTELANAICGKHSRFQICEVRRISADGFPDRMYAVRDADTVTDAQIKAGVRPAIVKWFDSDCGAEDFCLREVAQ
jgi:hypothetical protein